MQWGCILTSNLGYPVFGYFRKHNELVELKDTAPYARLRVQKAIKRSYTGTVVESDIKPAQHG